jgi:hypothetical protein
MGWHKPHKPHKPPGQGCLALGDGPCVGTWTDEQVRHLHASGLSTQLCPMELEEAAPSIKFFMVGIIWTVINAMSYTV